MRISVFRCYRARRAGGGRVLSQVKEGPAFDEGEKSGQADEQR